MKRITRILFLVLLLCPPLAWAGESHQSNLKHGDKQVAKMISDRPTMKEFVASDGSSRKISAEDSIWKWAAKAYGKTVVDSSIEWDSSKVSKPIQYLSEHVMPYKGSKGLIRIRQVFRDSYGKTRNATFEELWSVCIFELINIQNDENFLEIYHRSLRGEVTRERWTRLNTELEHQALLKLKIFFQEVWKPWAERNNYRYEQWDWGHNAPNDYQEWIAQYRKSKNNPYTYWEDYYDTKITPYLDKMNRHK